MTPKRPIIGVSADLKVEEGGNFPGHRQTFVYEDNVKSVELAGGLPVVLAATEDKTVIQQYAEEIDGLLLTGGADVNPLEYGEQPLENQGMISPERDQFEIALVKAVMNLNKPVLGICRGIQILNIAYGGTLYQDLDYIKDKTFKHKQASLRPGDESHKVSIEKDSYLYELFGDEVMTNSFHHQAIKEVAKGYKITARSEDGIVEGIQKERESKVMGVQWHPEWMVGNQHEHMLKLFKHLVKQAS